MDERFAAADPAPEAALVAFFRLSRETRALAIEASVLLLVARMLVARVPIRRWRPRVDMAPDGHPSDTSLPEDARRAARDLCRIVRKVARRRPLNAVCLPQAMAAQWMLRRRGIPSELVFGTRRSAGSGVQFHAWLRAGGETVLGGEEGDAWRPFEAAGRAAIPEDGARHLDGGPTGRLSD